MLDPPRAVPDPFKSKGRQPTHGQVVREGLVYIERFGRPTIIPVGSGNKADSPDLRIAATALNEFMQENITRTQILVLLVITDLEQIESIVHRQAELTGNTLGLHQDNVDRTGAVTGKLVKQCAIEAGLRAVKLNGTLCSSLAFPACCLGLQKVLECLVLPGVLRVETGTLSAVLQSLNTDVRAGHNGSGQFILRISGCMTRICSATFRLGGTLAITRHSGGGTIVVPVPVTATVLSLSRTDD